MVLDGHCDRCFRERADRAGHGERVVTDVDAVVSAGAVLARILIVDAGEPERAVGLDRRAQRDLVAGAELR